MWGNSSRFLARVFVCLVFHFTCIWKTTCTWACLHLFKNVTEAKYLLFNNRDLLDL